MIEIPNYTIESELGRGGMATVYLATQDMLSRHVALKVMLPDMARDENFRKSFLSEGKIIANLEHTNIVRVHDVGVIDDSILYMAMENLSGGTLKEKLTDRSLSYAESLRILEQVAAGLSYAHDKGYIHRDVKPGNILFRENGTAVLTDFGIAKLQDTSGELTRMGYTMGTVQYMSPEQAVTTDLDQRSDIYSLGLVFYEMLTGQKAFKAESTIQAIHQHTTVAPPELPEKYGFLQGTIDRVLAKEPADRFQTINEFIVAVKTAADVDKTVIRKLPVSDDLDKTQVLRPESSKPKQRRTGLVLGVVGGITLFGALLFGAVKTPYLASWLEKSEETSSLSKSEETAKKVDLVSITDKAKGKESEELERIAETKKKEEIKLRAKLEAEKRSAAIEKQEEKRLLEVAKQEEKKRLAEVKKQNEEKRLAEQKKQKEEEQIEKQKQEEQKRFAEAKKKEEKRLVEAEKQAEEKRLVEAKKEENEKRLLESKKKEEEEKRLVEKQEEKRLAEMKKQEEEKRLAEEEEKQEAKTRLAEKQKKQEVERKRLEEKSKKKERLAKQQKMKKEKALAKKKAAKNKKLAAKRKAEKKRKQLAALKAKKIAEANRRKQQLAKAKGHIKVSATLNGRPLKTSFVLIKGGKRVQTISGRTSANFTIPPGRYTLKTQYGGQVGSAIVNIAAYETAIQKFAFRGRAPAKKAPPRKAPPQKKEEWLHTHGSDGYHDPLQGDPLQ